MANLTPSKQTSTRVVPEIQPRFAPGSTEAQLMAEAKALVEGGWKLDDEQRGLEKTFHFNTYTKALDFLQIVGIRSKSRNHHSVMTIKYSSVHVHWTTHYPRGLSAKDTFMARYCDSQAKDVGAVDESLAQKCAPAPKA
ncbi:hypothetical protein MMC31_002852 [Peltigera leucophlebia]|nr:hypothetical protein [Peltigera leucophlebia]